MKKLIILSISAFFIINLTFGQSPERPKKPTILISEVVAELDKATGWSLQNNGRWTSSQNQIPFNDYKLNKINRGIYSLGQDNFNKIKIRQITLENKVYCILIINYTDGEYKFPILQENWKEFEVIKFFAFKEEKINLVFPDSIIFNKPYAINMRLLCSGNLPNFNKKTYLFDIENTIQKTLYLNNESVTNLIWAIYPVNIKGKKSLRFKFYEPINKLEIYRKYLLPYNWNKIFKNFYYEVKFDDFAEFINDIGVIDPLRLSDKNYYKYFLERGIKKYNSEQYVTALLSFSKAIKVNPSDSSLITILTWRGKAKLQLKEYQDAITDFDSAINKKPLNDEAYNDWMEAQYQKGNAYYLSHEYFKACENWQKALDFGYFDALKPIKKHCGKSDTASAYAYNLKQANKYFKKGLSFYNKKKYLKALNNFNLSVEKNPQYSDFEVYYFIGLSRYHLGDIVRSFDDFNDAYLLKPDENSRSFSQWVDVLVWRGKVNQGIGWLKSACDDWKEAENYGSAEATELFDMYCYRAEVTEEIEENAFYKYFEEGIGLYENGDNASAIEKLDKALRADPETNNILLFTYRASAKHKMHDYEGAIADFTRAIELKPEDNKQYLDWIRAYFNRGVSKYFLNDKNGACDDWKKARDLGLEDVEAIYYINTYCENEPDDFEE